MKILIADDEILVRNGLRSSINWERLGISAVLLAEDGTQALRIAQQERPEVVLTDVRMQRMDGIELATRLRKVLPNAYVIFMSGYSDKEYLKAAIQLKAVSYVEKPIICEEIEEAVAEAVRLVKEHSSNMDAQIIRSRVEKAQLATALAGLTSQSEASIRETWNALGLPPANKLWFATVLVLLTNIADCNDCRGLPELFSACQEQARTRQISLLHSTRNNQIVIHLYSMAELTRERINWFCLYLRELMADKPGFFISAGAPVRGTGQICLSYQSAMKALNGGFYDRLDSILLWNEAKAPPVFIDFDGRIAEFRSRMSAAAYEQARETEETLYQEVLGQRHLPADAVKNAYYQLISIMEWVATRACIPFSGTVEERTPWQIISASRTVHELHDFFTGRMDTYIELVLGEKEGNELVFLMKDYIRKNYQRDMLSVREIAGAACLSTAYACTMFKNETGTTINQFISSYRVERAKQLLADPRYKITDIASQLGYSDSNYFGKSFKRLVGLSPSEYREKVSKWDS